MKLFSILMGTAEGPRWEGRGAPSSALSRTGIPAYSPWAPTDSGPATDGTVTGLFFHWQVAGHSAELTQHADLQSFSPLGPHMRSCVHSTHRSGQVLKVTCQPE
jgi:hypothetical protein